ncbi:MAG: GerMN domain-containing protein [Ilumatobacteraceae bacterium]
MASAQRSSPRQIDPDRLPGALQIDHGTTTTIGTALVPLEVWFVRDDRLVGVEHQVEAPLTATKAVADLANGPTEADPSSLRSAIPDAQVIVETTVIDGTAIVELAEDFDQIPTTDTVLAIGQLVLTLTGLEEVDQVKFQRNQVDVAVPLPDSTQTDAPVDAEDFAALVVS